MRKIVLILLHILVLFVALTAIGGGIAILTKIDEFPLEWIEGTLFKSYTIPAIILTVIVGGSALLSAITLLLKKSIARNLCFISGLILSTYIFIEILILKQVPPGPTPIEFFYLLTGIIISVLGIFYPKLKK
jgi:DMSO reductase anchor subunit